MLVAMLRRTVMMSVAASAAARAAGSAPVEELEKRWVKAILTRDAAALDALLMDGLVYAHASGVVDTKASYIEKIRGGRQKYASLEQRKMTVRQYGDCALMHCWAHVTGVNPAGNFDDKVMMMHTWVQTKAGWRLAGHQTTKVDELPPA